MNPANPEFNKMMRLLFILVLAAPVWAQLRDPTMAGRANISVEQRLKDCDKNSDGKLTPEEVPGSQLSDPKVRQSCCADAVSDDFDNDGWLDLFVLDRHESPSQSVPGEFSLSLE